MQLRGVGRGFALLPPQPCTIKQPNPGLDGRTGGFLAGCGARGGAERSGGSQGRAKPGGGPGPASGGERRGGAQRRWVHPWGWVAQGDAAPLARFPPVGLRVERWVGGRQNPLPPPATAATQGPRGAEGGKNRRRSLQSGQGGGGFPSALGTEGARASKERGPPVF